MDAKRVALDEIRTEVRRIARHREYIKKSPLRLTGDDPEMYAKIVAGWERDLAQAERALTQAERDARQAGATEAGISVARLG